MQQATRPRAYFIDDAWAAPQRQVLAACIPSLRQLLSDHQDVKEWFVAEYKAVGDVRTSAYFDSWMESAGSDIEFWGRIASSPRFGELRDEWGELANIWHTRVELLEKVRSGLRDAGFDVVLFSSLPTFDPNDVPSIIVIDYMLSNDADYKKIAESTHWLGGVSTHCFQSPSTTPPFVLLISSALNPSETEKKALEFRKDSKTMSSYFRMVPKADFQFSGRVVGLAKEHHTISAKKLLEFYSVYKGLRKAYEEVAKEIADSIESLELEDLVTFHAAQLKDEGTLDDYLAWLYGQVLTSKLLKKVDFVKAGRGVGDSDEVLLGQLRPQQLIPDLFYEASFLATLEQTAPECGLEKIQFANMYQSFCEPQIVLLTVSQTCDLIQCKITNDQVLCVEGVLTELDVAAEASLLKLTIDQIAKEHQIYKVGGKYFSVNWGGFKDLRTVKIGHLNDRRMWTLIGRMNELYALNIQASAMQAVGRIGLPVVPHYVHYISKVSISLIQKNQGRVATKEISRGEVVGVVRPHKKANCDIYLPVHVREEMAQLIDILVALPNALKGIPNTGDISALLRDMAARGFTGKGDMEGKIDFKHGLNVSASGERSTKDRPKFAKIFASTALPAIEGGDYLEIVFLPI
ncbi:hypothetical protein [Burkholderia sp. Ed8]|uniref:hypothetical protein n=1 Tax=Burkholderia sp. Ed8 TaxID=3112957 RepID=UPI00345D6432